MRIGMTKQIFLCSLFFCFTLSAQLTGLSGVASSTTPGSADISWTDGGVYYQGPISFYQIFAGSSKGAQNYYNSGSMAVAGVTSPFLIPSGLPTNGSTIWVRLWHKHGNTWLYNDTSFASFADPGTPPPTNPYLPVITSPTPGSSVSSLFTLTWVPGNYRSFIVYAGLTPGSSTLENSGILPLDTTSYDLDLSSLSGGSSFWIRLWYKAGSSWKYIQASFSISSYDFIVTTLADSGTGSLRDIVGLAASAGGGTIGFASTLSGGTISLLTPITIPNGVSITGLGASSLSISGGSGFRIFFIPSGASVSISDITLSDGVVSDVGGAIRNEGFLSISNCMFSGNVATSSGGAIYNASTATLMLDSSTFTSNSASSGGAGGAIRNDGGAITIDSSTFTSNSAPNGFGGAIRNDGTITINLSIFTSNSTPFGFGGAIFNASSSTTTITSSSFISNTAPSSSGGAIRNGGGGTISIDLTSFTSNTASVDGGAILNSGGGSIGITSSSFDSNSAGNDGGALFNSLGASLTIDSSSFTGNTVPAEGGAINNEGSLDVDSSSFSFNSSTTSAAGAIYTIGTGTVITLSTFSNNTSSFHGGAILSDFGEPLVIDSSSFFDNICGSSAAGGAIFRGGAGTMDITASTFAFNSGGVGGAIFIVSGTITINNSTFTQNTTPGAGGAIRNFVGGGLTMNSCTIFDNSASDGGGISNAGFATLLNTILAGNTAGFSSDFSGSISSSFSFIGGNPMLYALADNGGPTMTCLPMTGSPVVDVSDARPILVDQRGFPRPNNATDDIGAVERQPIDPP